MGIKQLTALTLNKFRVFSQAETFEINPLTILTGANNSGKSSILKALLLLADNAQKYNLEKLDFLTGKHLLQSFKNALNDSLAITENKTFSFALQLTDSEDDTEIYTVLREYIDYDNEVILNKIEIHAGEILLAKTGKGENVYVNFSYFSQKYFLAEMQKKQKMVPKESVFLYRKKEKLAISHEAIQALLHKISDSTDFNERLGRKLLDKITDYCRLFTRPLVGYYDTETGIQAGFIDTDNKVLGYELGEKGIAFFQKIAEELSKIVGANNAFIARNIDSLAATRATNQRIILDSDLGFGEVLRRYFELEWELITTEIGKKVHEEINKRIKEEREKLLAEKEAENRNKGEGEPQTPVEISKEENDKILKRIDIVQDRSQIAQEIEKVTINDIHTKEALNPYLFFINKWISKDGFNIADKVSFERLADYGTIVRLHKGDKTYNLMDMGFGTSQLLPVIMKIAVSENQLLLLEEIENSLHPNYQSKLADLLVGAYQDLSIRFIIETHSEYLIRKFQVLVKRNALSRIDDIKFLYIKNGKVDEILIRNDGGIDGEFGTGFTDEADNLVIELYN